MPLLQHDIDRCPTPSLRPHFASLPLVRPVVNGDCLDAQILKWIELKGEESPRGKKKEDMIPNPYPFDGLPPSVPASPIGTDPSRCFLGDSCDIPGETFFPYSRTPRPGTNLVIIRYLAFFSFLCFGSHITPRVLDPPPPEPPCLEYAFAPLFKEPAPHQAKASLTILWGSMDPQALTDLIDSVPALIVTRYSVCPYPKLSSPYTRFTDRQSCSSDRMCRSTVGPHADAQGRDRVHLEAANRVQQVGFPVQPILCRSVPVF